MKIYKIYRALTSFTLIWVLLFLNPGFIIASIHLKATGHKQNDYSITLNITQTIIGSTVTVEWTAPDGHSSSDYIRLAQANFTDSNYNWNQNLGGATSGSFTVTIPNTVARYEFRVFRGTDNVRVSQSQTFVANKANYLISVTPPMIPAGGQIAVDWDAPINSPVTDRVVITPVNNSTVVSQHYTNGANPTITQLSAPTQPGNYEVKYFESNSSTPSAISEVFTVEASAGTIAGQVKKKETGDYISGALVEILQSNIVKATALTNINGSFSIPLSTTGVFDVRASASGLSTANLTNITVSSGNTVVVNPELASTGNFAGKITKNSSQTPISGANILLKQGSNTIASAVTDYSGNYNFNQLTPGSYLIEVNANGFTPITQNNVLITLGDTTTLNLSLTENQPGGGISNLEYIYDDAGRVVAVKEQNIVKNIYRYDLSGNLLSIDTPQGTNPEIISFTPRIGIPGTQVIIRGINFSTVSGQNAVSFNGTSASIFSFSEEEIVTTVPIGATTGSITLTTPNGTATSDVPFIIGSNSEDNLPPLITGFSPQIGHPGDAVIINGNNFETELTNNSVLFGAASAGILSGSSTSLTVAANTSSGKISVRTPNGTVESDHEFLSVPDSINLNDVNYSGRTWFGNYKPISIPGNKKGAATFNGISGKRFSIQLFHLSNHVNIDIYRPDGRLLLSTRFYSWTSEDGLFIDTQTIPITGTYTIIFTPLSTNTSVSFAMTVYDVPPDILDSLPSNGGIRILNMTTPGQNGNVSFQAEAGDRILMRIKDSTYEGIARITRVVNIGSSSTTVTTVRFLSRVDIFSPDNVTIPATGTYNISLDPSGPRTGPMEASLFFVPPDPVYSMDIGESSLVQTTNKGQNAWIKFDGTAGQRISLRVRDITYPSGFEISLNKPDGTFFATPIQANNGTFIDTLTLPVTGTYKIYINPPGYDIGEAMIDLFDVPPDVVGTTSINGTPIAISASVPGHNPSVTFNAVQGQRARVNISGASFPNGTQVLLRKPDGNVISSGSISSGTGIVNSTTLPETGVYTIQINPTGVNLGSATLSVGGDVLGTVTPDGTSNSVTINEPGQSAWLSFNGTTGQRVSLKLANVSINSGFVSFRNPDGTILGSTLQIGTNNNFLDTVTLPANGEYKVLVDPSGTDTGSATLTLYNVPTDSAGTISVGGNIETRSTTVPGQNLLLAFSGTANQKISLEVTNLSISTSSLYIIKSDGTTLPYVGSGTVGTVLENVVLPETGSYNVFVNPSVDNTGNISLRLYGTGVGSPIPSIQPSHSVSVMNGFFSGDNNRLSHSVSVQKGVLYGENTLGSFSTSVSVLFGPNPIQLPGFSVSVTKGPSISSVSPVQINRGTTVTATITGNNLSNVNALRFYNSGGSADTSISATNISVNAEGTILTANIQVGSSTSIGTRLVVLASAEGLTQTENTTTNAIEIIQ